jgi:hypothetical protein
MWRLMAGVKTVAITYPERVAAVEKALGPALKLVDQVLRMADTKQMSFSDMDRELSRVVLEHEHSEIKKGTSKQL